MPTINGNITGSFGVYVTWGRRAAGLAAGNADGADEEIPGEFEAFAADIQPTSAAMQGRSQWYLFNARGDVIALTDAFGHVIREHRYDAFGNEVDPCPYDTNPWRFNAEYFDRETGLYYLRMRFFNPRNGRFLNPDPLFWGNNSPSLNVYTVRQTVNLYAFVANNPVRFIDPSGLRLREFAEERGGSVVWDLDSEIARVTINGQIEYFKAGLNGIYIDKNGVMQICESVFNRLFGLPGGSFSDVYLSSASSNPNGLPLTGDPNSTGRLRNPDGSIKQERVYGPDGRPVRDRDFNHGGSGHDFPHDHQWDWNQSPPRQPGVPVPQPQGENNASEIIIAGTIVVSGGYLIYRGLRMLPSLLPPFWWTIPKNLVIP